VLQLPLLDEVDWVLQLPLLDEVDWVLQLPLLDPKLFCCGMKTVFLVCDKTTQLGNRPLHTHTHLVGLL
jgi:hypothetical protein